MLNAAKGLIEPGVSRDADERVIVARAQLGDAGAFEALYHLTSARIFALCLRMTGDREHAAELLQDVYIRIWRQLGSFRGESAFASWAHRVAVNAVLEDARRESRQEKRIAQLPQSEFTRGDSVDIRMDLDKAIARLTPSERRVFVLHDIEGYRHTEISRMTGLAQGTLRAQLHVARKRLIELLGDEK